MNHLLSDELFKGRICVCVKGSRRSHVVLRCCWKRKVLLSTRTKASRKKGCWLTMSLTTMIAITRAQFLK